MMLPDWASIATIISAMIEVVRFGRETFYEAIKKKENDPDLGKKIKCLQTAFSTYSAAERDAIIIRIYNCRQRFIEEGNGLARKRCLCSVLRDVREGNGGIIPDPEWESMYNALECDNLPSGQTC